MLSFCVTVPTGVVSVFGNVNFLRDGANRRFERFFSEMLFFCVTVSTCVVSVFSAMLSFGVTVPVF